MQGYADLSDARDDFYNRRMYRRLHVRDIAQDGRAAQPPASMLLLWRRDAVSGLGGSRPALFVLRCHVYS